MARRRKSRTDSKPRRRVKRWHAIGMFLLLGAVVFVAFLPSIATSKLVLSSAIDRFAGIAPLKVDFETVSAGWFKPVSAKGLKLLDENGNTIASIGGVATEKSILGWATGYSDLGTVRVSNLEAAIMTMDGTSNIEQALEPLLAELANSTSDPTPSTEAPTTTFTGNVEIVDSRFLFAEQGRAEQWVVEIPRLAAALPSDNQMIGPIELKARVADVSGTVPNSAGEISAQIQQAESDASFSVQANLLNVPIDFFHVAKARLPSIPIDELSGRFSGELSGEIVDDTKWAFDVQQLNGDNILVDAPELLGNEPARLQRVLGVAKCSLRDSMLTLEQAQLACDFANTAASAQIPWPISVPSLANPFLSGASINAVGTIDLPKLAASAQSLIPMREDMQFQSGLAQFSVTQTLDINQSPTLDAKIELSNLNAVAAGQRIQWPEPLTVEMGASKQADQLTFRALANAEFAKLQGGGSLENGQLSGNVNLSQLKRRLSQWVELPITDMQGTAGINLSWAGNAQETIDLQGSLNTTPIAISTTSGNQLQEPAWTGSFSGQLGLENSAPSSVNLAKLQLQSEKEQLTVNLLSMMSLRADTSGEAAAFTVDLQTDLEKCKRRGLVWLQEPPEIDVNGNLKLAVNGKIDMAHVEVLDANFNAEPIAYRSPQFSFAEPQMVGNFKGRIDSNDLTRLVVDALQVSSTSFSLGAQDSANPDGSGSRLGRAAFRANLNQLMQNVAAALPNTGAQPASQTGMSGELEGQLAWQISPTAAGLNTEITGKQLVFTTLEPGKAPFTLWAEDQVFAAIAGTWSAKDNSVNLPKLEVKTNWMNFVGNLQYSTSDDTQKIASKGNATYDCGTLSNKLNAYTGGQFQMSGQKTTPIDIDWTMSPNDASILSGLDANTSIGWQSASVAGILVGNADVPVKVTSGVASSATEIPVSGGALRWDFTTDLTQADLVIDQKPMRVLENVEITEQMCNTWLQYVTPLVAQATSVDGRLSVDLAQAKIRPMDYTRQSVTGQITIHNATVGPGPLSNSVIALSDQVEAIRKQDFTQVVSSRQRVWMDMPEQNIAFEMRDGRIIHRDLRVKVGDTSLNTSGSVGLMGDMNMVASMPIPDDWADKSQWLAGFRGQSLQFPIQGTLTNPKVDSQAIAQIGRQSMQNAASGAIQNQINRGLDKLLGSPPPATDPNAPADPNGPLRELGNQILGGQGLNLPGIPGLFPGGN